MVARSTSSSSTRTTSRDNQKDGSSSTVISNDKAAMHDIEKQLTNELGSATRSDNAAYDDEHTDSKHGTKQKYRYVPFIGRKKPRDPYKSLDDAPILPMKTANLFSQWTYQWIQPLLIVGYQKRTLEPLDLWKLDPSMEAGPLADKLMANFERRRKIIEDWNKSIDDGTYKPSALRKAWWRTIKLIGVGDGSGKRKVGLAWALSDTFAWQFWSAGLIKTIGDVSQVTSPLVTKALILFSTEAYYQSRGVPGYAPKSVGYGVGLCFVLWAMQVLYALCIHQFFVRSAGCGVLARGALITAVYRKAMVLSGKARVTITNGKLVNHISTDTARIDFCAGFFHIWYTSLVQLVVIVVILLVNLGPSSLAGIGFLFLATVPQAKAMSAMFKYRKKAMVWTDKRAKLIQELLGGMRIIKFFSWESPYLAKIDEIRRSEMFHIRNLLVIRAANAAIAMSMPALATVVAFLVYSGTGNGQDPAIIFTSLTLFNLLRMPLMMLPVSLATITDAHNALGRLTEVFVAETRVDSSEIDDSAKFAVKVEDADFQWEASPEQSPDAPKSKKKHGKHGKNKKHGKTSKDDLKAAEPAIAGKAPGDTTAMAAGGPTDAALGVPSDGKTSEDGALTPPAPEELMQLRNVNLTIPKGQLVAVVGPVGSGKSSLLQALIGEMKRLRGTVTFGGSIAYAPQQAWMQSASLRDNILFGQPYEEARYDKVVHDACLEADFAMLPSGDLTEIGEKGVTLSGGQKQRVNIARALYYSADIVLLDDPLSAVDAHVGKHLFEEAICGALAGKTRILVTHALHFLPKVDHIITMEQGQISEQGTFVELMAKQDGAFSRMYHEFVGSGEEKKEEQEEEEEEAIEDAGQKKDEKKAGKAIMQEEERLTGAVGWPIYKAFFHAARGYITLPVLVGALAFMQVAQVMQAYWLVWWQKDEFNKPNGFYMGLYAFLGVMQAVGSFCMGVAGVFLGYNASKALHKVAIRGVMYAPMSFFDTTPLGRIMNRFSKDCDTIDNQLNDALRMAFSTGASVLGAIILIAAIIPYFLPVVAAVLVLYFYASSFYRASAREIKRLDNFLRSSLYAHFGESLSGMATIRAYGESEKFLKKNEYYIDIENRAYFLTIVNQRWLGFRLDLFGSILTFVVAIFGVGTRTSISPSETGLVLSYILSIQAAFSWLVRQISEAENDMNSVERMLHYGNQLEQEAPAIVEEKRPEEAWPSQGSIEFDKVVMRYRPELPPVLKGLSLTIKGGEKIGVVGRTGAGKSSIMQALFRIVELNSGTIKVDGQDISEIGLRDLREKLAIIPQDALLFNGTIRTNLDPFGQHSDHEMWDALKRAWLVDKSAGLTTEEKEKMHQEALAAGEDQAAEGAVTQPNRFSLDLVIEDEGLNLSVGERSLVSLARALVRDSKIIVLDEATASVDLSTDAKIQRTIREQFTDKTLLIIAHRLRTIIDCDRVLVMSDGQVAEFDTPINLFRMRNGIFASMCERSGITEADMLKGGFIKADE
ncbi:hypothetical protein OIO90_001171 [Microbotryomycetes sp. JL221]|nr:hypothetical protein OIO90_001171 [Microbotryomycetes sp. JL221]